MKKFDRLTSISLIVLVVSAAMSAACGAPQSPATGATPSVAPTREPIAPVSTTALTAALTVAPTTAPTAMPLPTIPPTAPAATAPAATASSATATLRPGVPLPTATVPTPLSKTGPWLVYQTDRGVIAANPDGSGQQLITDQPILRNDLPDGASSHGWLALRIGAHSLDDIGTTNQTVTLTLVHLPDGQIKPIGPLLSPDMQQAIKAAAGDRNDAIEAGIAIFENSDTLKWSPDGRYLAFIAAIDGPSSDLYSYDMQTGQINRLTDGLNQAASLNWSPDSRWIVHEEVENFGTGAGWNVKAVWAAAPDGSQTRKVYDAPQSSGGEQVIGWTAPDTFIVYTWQVSGPQSPRLINVNTGAATPIKLDMLKQGDWSSLVWATPAHRFYVTTFEHGVSSATLNNRQPQQFADEVFTPAVSPDGQRLAFWGNSVYGQQRDGVRVYAPNGDLIREITTDAADFVTWQPDGAKLFYMSDGTLYTVQLPDGRPVPIEQGAQVSIEGGLGWVQR